MRLKISRGNRYLFLEEQLFLHIEELVDKFNKNCFTNKEKLKIDLIVFFLDLICRKQGEKDAIKNYGYAKLCATNLKNYRYDYDRYLNWLIDNKIIKRQPYDSKKGKCFGYKVIWKPPFKKRSKNSFKLVKHEIIDLNFSKKLWQKDVQKMERAYRKCRHLTKWLNKDNINIDSNAAKEFLNNRNMDFNKFRSYLYAIEAIEHGHWSFSREGADNRLHSNLSNFPSQLRQFITHRDEKLISLDLKSSQPYMFSGLLNLMMRKDYDTLDILLGTLIDSDLTSLFSDSLSIMIPKTQETLINKGIRRFIKLVVEGDIYMHIGNNYSPSFLDSITTEEGFQDTFYDEQSGSRITRSFASIREHSKQSMLEYLYCSPKSTERRYREVRAIIPNAINEFIDDIKTNNKSDFPILLQNIEAHLFLDVISKTIAREFPDMFVATIHDSIVVPISNYEPVKQIMQDKLFKIFSLTPKIKEELWSKEIYQYK
ncbi:hypothetical protein FGF1_12990 [Flavobacteriaceae bacterium GF1]